MRNIIIISIIIIMGIIAGIVLINTSSEENTNQDRTVKVGVLMIGNNKDASWCESHYDGLVKTEEELNIELIFKEDVPEDDSSAKVMEELIKEGCEIIVCTSFGYGEYALEVAKKHPEVFIFHATGVNQYKNLTTYFGRIYQMRYLAGVVAGLQTESDSIGYVAAFPISEVNRGINAFTLGVKSVNPNATVYVKYCNSWNSDEAANDATQSLYSKHPDIDVFAMHTDSLKVCEFAEEHNVWCIGYNIDNSTKFPKSFLTAPVWNWENYYIPEIRECLQGKFQSTHTWAGIETNVVDLAPLTDNVKPQIAKKVEEERKHLANFDYDVFFGPIKDNEGTIRVDEGESMTDDMMMNEFDWYVEGVVIEDE